MNNQQGLDGFQEMGSVDSTRVSGHLGVQNIRFALPDPLSVFSSPLCTQEADPWGLYLVAPLTPSFLLTSAQREQGLETRSGGRVRLGS